MGAKDTVCVAREDGRACRYVIDEWAYLTRTEGLNWRFSTDPCFMCNCKATVKRCCLGSAHFTCLWSKLADHRLHRPGNLCIEATKWPSWAPGVAETDPSAFFRNFQRVNMEIVLFKGRHVYLARNCFLPSYQADLNDIEGVVHRCPVEIPKTITGEAIRTYISRVNASKASGPDAISNRALNILTEQPIDVLEKIFNQCLDLAYHPKHFREATTIALRKLTMETIPKQKINAQ